jgi:hypothetical protein
VLSRRSMSRFFWLCMSTWDSEGEIAMGAMLGMCVWVGCNLIDLIERRLNLGKTDGRVWGSGDCCGGGYLCGTRYLWSWTIGSYLYTITDHQERNGGLHFRLPVRWLPAGLNRQAKRIAHTET